MKTLKISLLMCLFSVASFALDMQVMEGQVKFEMGQYYIQGDEKMMALSGMGLNALRKYEGQTVKVAGEDKGQSLEIYKVFVKKGDTYETSYDWDMVNQDLYLD